MVNFGQMLGGLGQAGQGVVQGFLAGRQIKQGNKKQRLEEEQHFINIFNKQFKSAENDPELQDSIIAQFTASHQESKNLSSFVGTFKMMTESQQKMWSTNSAIIEKGQSGNGSKVAAKAANDANKAIIRSLGRPVPTDMRYIDKSLGYSDKVLEDNAIQEEKDKRDNAINTKAQAIENQIMNDMERLKNEPKGSKFRIPLTNALEGNKRVLLSHYNALDLSAPQAQQRFNTLGLPEELGKVALAKIEASTAAAGLSKAKTEEIQAGDGPVARAKKKEKRQVEREEREVRREERQVNEAAEKAKGRKRNKAKNRSIIFAEMGVIKRKIRKINPKGKELTLDKGLFDIKGNFSQEDLAELNLLADELSVLQEEYVANGGKLKGRVKQSTIKDPSTAVGYIDTLNNNKE